MCKPTTLRDGSAGQKVAGRTVVITGGSQGCGRALATLFAQEGYNVVLAARAPERLEAAALECSSIAGNATHLAVPTDVTKEQDVQKLADTVLAQYDSVDVVVNNAGVCLRGTLDATTAQDFQDQMAVNFIGPMLVSKAFTGALKQSAQRKDKGPKPTLLMVNSFGGRMPLKGMSAYTASKFALAGFTDSIRAELAADGVAVVQVHPGVVASNFMERAQFRGDTAEQDSKQMAETLAGGSGIVQTPEQVAQACMTAYKKGQKEVVVGLPFKLLYSAYNTFGLNPFAM